MISTIALIIIAIAICVLTVMYYRKRNNLVQKISDIDYALAEMRTSLNKIEHINNKLIAVENKVQTSIDRITSVKTYIENDVTMHLSGIKAGQEIYINKFYSKTDKLQNTLNALAKENVEISEALLNNVKKMIADSETRTSAKLNTINERLDAIGGCAVMALDEKKNHCGAKNSSKTSKAKNNTKVNKQENEKLITAE